MCSKFGAQQLKTKEVFAMTTQTSSSLSCFSIFCFLIIVCVQISVLEGQEPIVLWWTPFTGEPGAYRTCNKHYTCYFTENRDFIYEPSNTSMVVMFYGSDFKPVNLPLPRKNHLWALLHEESPKNNPILCHKPAITVFNFTATFRRESSFPLTLFSLRNLAELLDVAYYVPTMRKNALRKEEGLAPILYIQSACDAPSDRDLYVQELMKYVEIDSYGACLHNKDLPVDLRNPIESMKKEEFLLLAARYKFTLAFENAVCKDYITEKLWRPLQLGSVPIYMGSPQVKDWAPNAKAVIAVDEFSSAEDLATFLKLLNANDTLYEEYLEHKLFKRVSNRRLLEALEGKTWGHGDDDRPSFVEQFECYVCEQAHKIMEMDRLGFSPTRYIATMEHFGCPVPVDPVTKVENAHNWWVDHWYNTEVEASVMNELIQAARNYTTEEFYELVIQHL